MGVVTAVPSTRYKYPVHQFQSFFTFREPRFTFIYRYYLKYKIRGAENGINHRNVLSTGPLPTPPERAVRACLEVKNNLSQAYELPDGTIVTGEILEIKGGGLTDKEKEIVKEIEGTTVRDFIERFPKKDIGFIFDRGD